VTAPVLAIAWLTPAMGIAVASVLVPLLVALYFLKLRRRPAAVPSTLLWKRSVEDVRANTPFQRLRPSVLLFLQLALLGFVAFALAQPRIDLGLSAGGRTVFLVDVSASMGATDLSKGAEQTSRLDVAREGIRARIESIHSGGLFAGAPGECMVIAFAGSAKVIQPFTRSKGDLLRAVDRLEQTDGASALGEGLALARAFATVVDPESQGATPAESAVIELWSDGRIADLGEESIRPGETLVYRMTGRADATNLGIEGIAAERSITNPGLMQVFVTLRNDGPAEVESDVELWIDGSRRAVTPTPIRVPAADPGNGAAAAPDGDAPASGHRPGGARALFPPFVQPRAGVVEVRLSRADALSVDDRAVLAVAAPRRLRVAMVGPMDFAVSNVLRALPVERLQALTAAEFAALDADADRFDVVVATAAALPQALGPGRYLVFGAPRGVLGLNPYGTKEGLAVRAQRTAHPLLRAVNLDDLYVSMATAMAPGSDVESIVDGPDVPLVVVARQGGATAVVVGFDPLDSNWPFQRSFVTFLANAVEWLGSLDQPAAQAEHRPGDAITARIPGAVREVRIVGPSLDERIPVRDGAVTFGPVQRAGVYRLTWSDEGAERQLEFAVNPAEGEGWIAAAERVQVGTEVVDSSGSGGSLSDLWPYALVAALVLLVLEWWAYHRRHWVRAAPGAAPVRPLGAAMPGARGAPIIRP
jgi:hypothetical protein